MVVVMGLVLADCLADGAFSRGGVDLVHHGQSRDFLFFIYILFVCFRVSRF